MITTKLILQLVFKFFLMRLGKIQRKTLPIIREDFQTRNVILLTLFIFRAIRNTHKFRNKFFKQNMIISPLLPFSLSVFKYLFPFLAS